LRNIKDRQVRAKCTVEFRLVKGSQVASVTTKILASQGKPGELGQDEQQRPTQGCRRQTGEPGTNGAAPSRWPATYRGSVPAAASEALATQESDGPSKLVAHKRISDEGLMVCIRAIHAEVRQECGWLKMWQELVARSHRVGKEGYSASFSRTASGPDVNASMWSPRTADTICR
jgi:hypothetical protein